MKRIFKALPLVAVTALLSTGALAQQVILKVHHFLPAGSTQQKKVIEPWCERINKDSKDRLKCQIYPSMQLGGTPPQLVNQVAQRATSLVFNAPYRGRLHFGVRMLWKEPDYFPIVTDRSLYATRQ